ncbi:YajG family lipoprotein [uncultured Amphritea sp.]|uniref:YajG family lipoprotein n=1 Tax=Amphritea sp. TaxID=1872502 RepID=UPI0025F8F505|nr:YajG family lipoprotein [uncultured Amphritea sp.]
MRKAIISVFTSIFLLSGCSTFKPHQISVEPLNPTVTTSSTLPADLQIEIHSKDMRSSDLIGYRISRFSDRAEINLPLPASEALTQGARAAVVKLGAVPTQSADTRLTVELSNLEYSATQSALQSVRLNATIKVTAEKNSEFISGNYSTEKEYQYVATPSLEDNQKMVNEVLLMTISRAFNDTKLINFLAR